MKHIVGFYSSLVDSMERQYLFYTELTYNCMIDKKIGLQYNISIQTVNRCTTGHWSKSKYQPCAALLFWKKNGNESWMMKLRSLRLVFSLA